MRVPRSFQRLCYATIFLLLSTLILLSFFPPYSSFRGKVSEKHGPTLSSLSMKNQFMEMSSAPAGISHLRWCFLHWQIFAKGPAGPWAPSALVLSPKSAQHHGPKCRVRSPFPSSCRGSTSFSPLKVSEPCRSSLNLPAWPSEAHALYLSNVGAVLQSSLWARTGQGPGCGNTRVSCSSARLFLILRVTFLTYRSTLCFHKMVLCIFPFFN